MHRQLSSPLRPVLERALTLSVAVGCVLLITPVGLTAHDRAGQVADGDSLSHAVDRLFERWHRPDSPGAAVLVMHHGEVVHARGYGMASLEHGVPIRTSTVFDIASVSKQFGAFAIALLEAEGKISLDDHVREYIPELPDFGHPITIRHLVHHTSGLRDWPGTLAMAGWDWEDVMSFEQILRMAFHQTDLNFEPGSQYAYSNTGYNLLAELVARVSGMSFREFCRTRIFEPLGMHRTHFHDDHTEVVPDRADSYRPRDGDGFGRVTSNLTALGSSSLFTTVEDLARWVRNFDEPRVGDPALMARIHERGVLNNGDTISYAWGQNVDVLDGVGVVSHGGSWAGYRSTLMRFPEQRFAVIILANTANMNPGELGRRIARIYMSDVFPEPVAQGEGAAPAAGAEEAEPDPWRPDPAELDEYAGVYRSPELDTTYRLEVHGELLVARHFRRGPRPMQAAQPDLFHSPGFGEVRFLRNEEGQVVGFTANQVRIRGLLFERIGN